MPIPQKPTIRCDDFRALRRNTPREVFELRCWARARLYAEGEYSLHNAVDELQAAAEQSGLVAAIGQDAVQEIMATAFAAVRDDLPAAEPSSSAENAWNAPSWGDAARDYHEARGDRVSIVEPGDLPDRWDEMSVGELWRKLNDPRRHGVANSTLDAAEYVFRSGDSERWRQWFDARSAPERAAILKHLEAWRRRK
jgi:hypothetical protein